MKKLGIALLLTVITIIAFTQTEENCLNDLKVPEHFSPKEGEESFKIVFPCDLEDFKMVLFDSYGETIYVTADKNFKWDGRRDDGNPAADGTHFWKMEFTLNGITYEKSGSFIVVN